MRAHSVGTLFLGLFLTLGAEATMAETLEIRTDESILAIVTHKAGFAAAKAHNHLIAASSYDAELSLDPAKPTAASFAVSLQATDLAVDRWDLVQAWYPRLEALAILDEPLTEVAERDQQKIRKSMLSGEQLDAKRFPKISARIESIEEKPASHGSEAFPYSAQLSFEVRGQRVAKPVAARFETSGDLLTIEAVGTFRFSDFGIEPFSAFFGAVKNQDEFHVYVSLAAAAGE